MALSDSKSQDSTDTCAICFQKKNQLFMKKLRNLHNGNILESPQLEFKESLRI